MISLVIHKGTPVSVCVDRHAFPIVDGELEHAEDQRLGCKFEGKEEQYNKAYDLARWAHENNCYDEIVRNL